MVMSVYQLEKFLEKASKRLGLDHMRFVVTQGEDPQTVEIEVTCSYDSVFTVDWFLDDGAWMTSRNLFILRLLCTMMPTMGMMSSRTRKSFSGSRRSSRG